MRGITKAAAPDRILWFMRLKPSSITRDVTGINIGRLIGGARS